MVPPGEVSGTWTVAGSPYVVQGDVEIPHGDTLVIDPGVTVQFEPDAGLTANGALTAVGTAPSLIQFTSAQASPSPGDWEGLKVSSSLSSLAWIEIDYAITGLLIRGSSPNVSDCTIRSNEHIGIRVEAEAYGCFGSLAAPTIDRCLVELNSGGGVKYHGYGSTFAGCTIPKIGRVGGTLADSTIRFNTGTGIVIQAFGGYRANGFANPEILDCDIHDNGEDGIRLTGDDPTAPTIRESNVYLNAESGIVRESLRGTVSITDNELRENGAVGLRNSSSRTIVSGNWIIDNGSDGVVTPQLRRFSENTLYGNAGDHDFVYLDADDQMAPLNDWGTTDPAVIDSRIWDRLDVPTLGRVVLSPTTDFVVTPESAVDFSGPRGGPFYPWTVEFRLWNTETVDLGWEASGAESWLSVTPSSSSLSPLDSVSVAAKTTAEAESLARGTHTATLSLLNTTTGDGDTQRTVRLTVMEKAFAFVDACSEGVYAWEKSIAVSPDGAHVLVASASTLSVLVRDAVTGALALLEEHQDGVGGVDGLAFATSVTLSPDGENVYVTGEWDNAVAVFDRSPVTGTLTFLEFHEDDAGGVDGLFAAASVAVSPDGAHVYVAGRRDDAVAVFARDTSTGGLTFVEVQQDGVNGVAGLDTACSVALSPDGTHVYVATCYGSPGEDFLTVFARDTGTGTLTFLETHEDGALGVDGLKGESRVALSPDGAHVYVTGFEDDAVALFIRDTSTGSLSFRRVYESYLRDDGLNGLTGLAVSGDGAYLFVVSSYDDALNVFERNAASGELLFVGVHRDGVDGVDGLETAQAVAVSPDGTSVYVVSGERKVALFSRASALVPIFADGFESGDAHPAS